jgi:hypothetical protein
MKILFLSCPAFRFEKLIFKKTRTEKYILAIKNFENKNIIKFSLTIPSLFLKLKRNFGLIMQLVLFNITEKSYQDGLSKK